MSGGRKAAGGSVRKDHPGRRARTFKGWKPQHRRAAALRAHGATWARVADELGYREETVCRYTNLPGWDELVNASVSSEARNRVREEVIPAFNRMVQLAMDDDGRVAVKAAHSVLAFAERLGLLKEAAMAAANSAQPGSVPAAQPSKLGSLKISNTIPAPRQAPAPPSEGREDDGDSHGPEEG